MNSSNPNEMLGKHDFRCGFPTMFQAWIQRRHSTRSPAPIRKDFSEPCDRGRCDPGAGVRDTCRSGPGLDTALWLTCPHEWQPTSLALESLWLMRVRTTRDGDRLQRRHARCQHDEPRGWPRTVRHRHLHRVRHDPDLRSHRAQWLQSADQCPAGAGGAATGSQTRPREADGRASKPVSER